ncbi:MAG: glycosyltransferase family 39 protein [Caldilineaceae bacterium SB0661_bin_32]|uniref:Glycosyltransferase family 39 protein n=1 Tax=Caldilineaceae bacterium SB0661_bin_32 TaxID=2605255 RepID=A0A6B1D2C0_9CHLR|nr:glycosyltransferase family 39 protein [Caldilineaceae bacterium SB0661_bin_32]
MQDRRKLYSQRFKMSKHISTLLPAALFLVSLTCYSLHWLTAPPGINGDASRLGLYAFDFVHDKLVPFYIYHQFGPHPLIIYIQALVFSALGFTHAALRGITIVGGALAAPAIYVAALWLFHQQGTAFARRAGAVAALGIALSTFFASFSRYGVEGALLPAVELLAIAFLWRGLRRGAWADFAVAGFAVGLSQYIYIAARFFPVALAVACAGAVLANRQLLARWKGLVIAAAVAAAVALPQWLLFITHPYTFFARTQQSTGRFVFELPDPFAVIAGKLVNQLLMLAWRWDNGYNPLSYRSLLTPVLVVALVTGVVYTIRKRQDMHVFAFLMMLAMFLPDLLAYEGANPSATRLVPALPFIFMMAGSGGAILWERTERIRTFPKWAGYLVPLLVLSFGLVRQWDYATRVKSQVLDSSGLEWKNSLVEVAVAEYIGTHLDAPVLIPASEYQRAPLAFLLAEHFRHRTSGLEGLVEKGEIITVVQPTDPVRPTTEWIPAVYRQDEWVLLKDGAVHFLPPLPGGVEPLTGEEEAIVASNGVVAATAFTARWKGAAPSFIPLQANFANNLDLVGYESSNLEPGSPLDITLYWHPARKVERDVEIFVELYDPIRDAVVANAHRWPLNGVYRVRAWQPGKRMPLSLRLSVAYDLAPGPYQLRTGVVDLTGRNRIPLSTGGDFMVVETLKIPLPEDHREPEISADVNFGDVITLDGYTLKSISDGLTITLFWRATALPRFDFTTFVHIIDSDDQIVAQLDAQPRNGQYPTSIWSPNEAVADELTVTDIPSGAYRIYIGLYRHHEDSWERLPIVSNGAEFKTDRLWLETITIP